MVITQKPETSFLNTQRSTSLFMIHILLVSLQLDCFKQNTTAIYDTQRDSVNFTASPSTSLVGDELSYCNNTMNGQTYDLTILLGNISFFLPSQIYNNSNSINVRVPCATGQNCSYAQVQYIQAATYVMAFTKLNVNVTSIVGQYDVQLYNHMDCLGGAILTFDVTKNEMNMMYTNKARNCTIDGGRYNFSYTLQGTSTTIPFTNQPMSYQTTYMNGALLLDNLVPFPLYKIAFNESNITMNTDPKNFINDLKQIGTITSKTLPQIPTIIGLIRQNKIKSMHQYLKLKSTVEQTVNTQQIKMDYNITVSYYITKKFNLKQDNCLVNMTLLLEAQDLLFKAAFDPKANQCGKNYINSLGISYNNIQFYLQVVQNEDFTGFFYDQTFTIPNYTIGDNIHHTVPCKQQDDCSDFSKLIKLYQQFPNITLTIQQVYLNDDEPVFRTTYVPKVLTRPYYDLVISMRQESVCFSYQPSQNDINTLYLIFSDLFLEYQFFTLTNQTVYCQEYTQQQSQQVRDLIQSDINSQEFVSYIGQYRISSVKLIIYYVSQANYVPWLIMGVSFLVIIIISAVLTAGKIYFVS